jgi:erythronate-4-phosphate dehydrogenase
MNIVADPNIPFVREAFGSLGNVELISGRRIDTVAVRNADVLLVRSVTKVHAGLLDGSNVKFVATATIGTDHVDRAYLEQRHIGFAGADGSNANSVAEYAIAALLELAGRKKFRLRDKTLGVIGVGNIGKRVVRLAAALGMRVLQNDPPRQRAEKLPDFVPLQRVLAEADVITLHVPLLELADEPTFHLIDKDTLDALERHPIIINTSRGAVVGNKALQKAVDGDKLGGAVLDVWEWEPNISAELLDVVDIGTPHIAGYSLDGKVNGTNMIYQAVCNYFGHVPTWDPAPLMPPPVVPQIELSVSSGEDDEEILRRIVQRVYDINADDAALRQQPREFDLLRANYPIRRDFFNTEVVLRGAADSLRQKAAALGFRMG